MVWVFDGIFVVDTIWVSVPHSGLSHWETHDNPTTSKPTNVDIKGACLVEEWNSFHLSGKKLDYLHLKDFLNH